MHDDQFSRWWASNKGRSPTPEDHEEFEAAKAIWDELWGTHGDFQAIAVTEQPEKTYQDGWRECALAVLNRIHPLFEAVWDEWLWDKVADYDFSQEHRDVSFRALRSRSEHEFLVARIADGAQVASLDVVQETICEVKTLRGNDFQMRQDYRAAEAFASLLTALPSLLRLRLDLEEALGRSRTRMLPPVFPLCPQCGDDGRVEVILDDTWKCMICGTKWEQLP